MVRSVLSLLLAALLSACGRGSDEPVRNVLLITLDTTRYNALGCYGNPQNPTPNIDRLANEGIVYLRARTVTPLTMPSHASMLTGLYPARHTVFGNGVKALPQSARTLAELARAEDVETAAFVSAIVLDRTLGLDQGFEVYEGPPRTGTGPGGALQLRAPEIVERATRWFAGRDRGRPFFAWLHFFDAHAPYDPPPELAAAMRSAYLGEVAHIDRSLGPLLDALRADGTLDETLVIIVGDHGESFRAHGEPTHGWYCYDGTLRVPMIVRYPDGFRAGSASTEIVSVVDVHPTALAALGLPAADDLDGVSLFRREAPTGRGVYFELYNGWLSFGWSPLVGWYDARGKYIHSSTPEYFEVESDKQEADNLVERRPAEVQAALRSIRAVLARPRLEPDPLVEVGADVRGALKTLGYFGADSAAQQSPDPLDCAGLPSPRDRRDEMIAFHEAQIAGDEGRHEEAVALLSEIAKRYPSNALARIYLANELVELRRFPDARVILEELAARGQARANDYNSLGYCREVAGDLDGARAAYRRALELDPGHPWAKENVARLAR